MYKINLCVPEAFLHANYAFLEKQKSSAKAVAVVLS
jgi:hypothetical protein